MGLLCCTYPLQNSSLVSFVNLDVYDKMTLHETRTLCMCSCKSRFKKCSMQAIFPIEIVIHSGFHFTARTLPLFIYTSSLLRQFLHRIQYYSLFYKQLLFVNNSGMFHQRKIRVKTPNYFKEKPSQAALKNNLMPKEIITINDFRISLIQAAKHCLIGNLDFHTRNQQAI